MCVVGETGWRVNLFVVDVVSFIVLFMFVRNARFRKELTSCCGTLSVQVISGCRP